MTFELETLPIDYRRKTTQKVTGFFCKICMKLWKIMILGFPPEQKSRSDHVGQRSTPSPRRLGIPREHLIFKYCHYALDAKSRHACDIFIYMLWNTQT
jgi:hypothetical protein